jgi:hypothetical protein
MTSPYRPNRARTNLVLQFLEIQNLICPFALPTLLKHLYPPGVWAGITSLVIGGTLVLISLNTNSIGGLIPLSTGMYVYTVKKTRVSSPPQNTVQ